MTPQAPLGRLNGVPYAPLPRGYGGALDPYPPRGICLHDTGNPSSNAAGEAAYAVNRTDDPRGWTSAHFYVDKVGPIGSVPLTHRAWAAFDANDFAWHIEMCRQGSTIPPATIGNAAALVGILAALGNIPLIKLTPDQIKAGRRGVFGHYDITLAYRGDHIDPDTDPAPGQQFDWGLFIQLAQGTGEIFMAALSDAEQREMLANMRKVVYATVGGDQGQPPTLAPVVKIPTAAEIAAEIIKQVKGA